MSNSKKFQIFSVFLIILAISCKKESVQKTHQDITQVKNIKKNWQSWEGIGSITIGFETSSFKPKTGLNMESLLLESDSIESIFFKSAGEPKPKTGLNMESWWLDFESDSTESIFFKSAGEPKKVSHYDFYKLTCKVKGKISQPGHYGHLNNYKRKIIIESILEVIQ